MRPSVIEKYLTGSLIILAAVLFFTFYGSTPSRGQGGGSNLPAPCCNCFAPTTPPTPIGCLNRVCPSGPAIWDPQTKICGCSRGGGGGGGGGASADEGSAGSGGGGGAELSPDEQEARDKLQNLANERFSGDYQATFDHYAQNGSLGPDELKNLLKDANVGNVLTRGFWADRIIQRFDGPPNGNGDGRIDWGEFNRGQQRQ